MKRKKLLRQKLTAIILGFILCIILLEIALRLGGFMFLSLQEYRNRLAIKQKGSYRILCLGDSMTARQYPRFLEEALNKKIKDVEFTVIDKAKPETTSKFVISLLEVNLNEYNPDMVICMIGFNDGGDVLPYGNIPITGKVPLKTYKLAKILWYHLINKAVETGIFEANNKWKDVGEIKGTLIDTSNHNREKEESSDRAGEYKKTAEANAESGAYTAATEGNVTYINIARRYMVQGEYNKTEKTLKKVIAINPNNDDAYVGLGQWYMDEGEYDKAMSALKKAIEVNPDSDAAYTKLGVWYVDHGNYTKAEEMFEKAIAINPKDDRAYVKLGWCYKDQGRYDKAEETLRRIIDINPDNYRVYVELGNWYAQRRKYDKSEEMFKRAKDINTKSNNVYFGLGRWYGDHGDYTKTEKLFKKAIELNPNNDWVYLGLARCYGHHGKYDKAIEMFRKSLSINPKNDGAYRGLAWCYRKQKRYDHAIDMLKKAIKIKPADDEAYGSLAFCYNEMGKYTLAKKYFTKANRLRLEYYNPITRHNYQSLKEILSKRAIKFLCVQYPVRSIEPLKKLFDSTEGIIFVDNEKLFKDAIKQTSYNEYFIDMFGGDFGHCTEKGNRLLAENIADAIVKECFLK